jgi:ATP-dependent 26S proteasome regulatory subunit
VSNILNLTDGILGDCLNIQIVATFNMKREKIDPALLRKGRLIAEHKFENLSVDDTNKLLKHLNKDIISDVGLSLADIYNVDIEVHKTKTKSKIGLF